VVVAARRGRRLHDQVVEFFGRIAQQLFQVAHELVYKAFAMHLQLKMTQMKSEFRITNKKTNSKVNRPAWTL